MSGEFSFTLIPDPATPSAAASDSETSTESLAAKEPLSFLGNGVLRPFRRDLKNDVAHGAGLELFKARIGQILGTKADSAVGTGELPWRTEFGSRLHLLRHKSNRDVLVELARTYVVEALKRWERRALVTSVTIDNTTTARTLMLKIKFTIVDQSGRSLTSGQETLVPVAMAA